MDQYYGYFLYPLSLLTMGGIYSVLTLGLNVQWGFTGLFNAGIAGFFAVGPYVQASLTPPISARHLGAYAWPHPVALPAAVGKDAPTAAPEIGHEAASSRALYAELSAMAWPCCSPRSLMDTHAHGRSRLGGHGTRSTSWWQMTIAHKI